jgi:hypothetical protein
MRLVSIEQGRARRRGDYWVSRETRAHETGDR